MNMCSFYLLTVVNSAAMNINVQVFVWIPIFSFFEYILRSGIVGSYGNSCSVGDWGLIPESGRSPGEGNGNPPQYSCLENSMDRGAWWATAHGVRKSQAWPTDWHCNTVINSILTLWGVTQLFHSSYTVLHPHQPCMRVPAFPHSLQQLSKAFLDDQGIVCLGKWIPCLVFLFLCVLFQSL